MEKRPQETLLKEVSRKLLLLEDAITSISTTRTQLTQRSMEVKSDIQKIVTRQLETLREREMALLRQVDLIHEAKDAALQGQGDKLHEALGSLNTALQGGEAGPDIQQILDRLEMLKMQPAETSTLSFKANLSQVNEALNNFGQIDGSARPFDGMFGEDEASESLPKPFEDYDDEDHHVLYKSLSNSASSADYREKSSTQIHEISVCIPRLSQRPEDWLFMPTETITPVQPVGHFQFPPFASSNLKELMEKNDGMTRSASSAASIQQWLCDIQGQAQVDEEDADFELISPPASFVPASTQSSSIEVLDMEEAVCMNDAPLSSLSTTFTSLLPAADTTISPTQAYFNQIMAGPSAGWLLAPSSQAFQPSSATYCREILSYFHNISRDAKMWLHQYTSQKQKEDCTSTCAAQRMFDIENLGQLACVQEVTSDPQHWLYTRKDEDVGVDEAEQDEEIQAKCKANEPCLSFRECVSDENCCSMLDDKCCETECSTVIDVNLAECTTENITGYFDRIVKQSSDNWLLSNDDDDLTTVTEETVDSDYEVPAPRAYSDDLSECSFPPFAPRSNQTTCWLMSSGLDTDQRVPPCSFEYFTEVPRSSDNKWLAERSHGISAADNMLRSWESMFSHNMPKMSASKSGEECYFDGNMQALDQSPVQAWLMQPKSYVPNISSSVPSRWLITNTTPVDDNDKCERKLSVKEAWLASGLHSSSLDSVEKSSKEMLHMPNKKIELPEGSDAGSECKALSMDSLFECFRQKEENKLSWLCNDNILVE